MSAAWEEIEEGAQRRLRENRERLQELYSGDEKPLLLGHIEKTEEAEPDRPTPTRTEKSVLLKDQDEQMEEVRHQQKQWDELEKRLAKDKQPAEKETSNIDLEREMERETETERTEPTDEQTVAEPDSTGRDPAGSEAPDSQEEDTEQTQRDPADSTVTETVEEIDQRDPASFLPDLGDQDEGYSKRYRTGPQQRSDRGAVRREKQEQEERKRVRQQQEEIERLARESAERERGNQVVNDALLKEEEEEAKKRLAEICRIRRDKKKQKAATSTKTDEDRKKKKRRVSEDDEDEPFDLELDDDIDADPDYNPDDDQEDEESVSSEYPDIIEVEKHAHCLNLKDSGEFMVWIREQLVELENHVKVGGSLAASGYREFVGLLRDGIYKMRTWSPIEAADVNLVMKTVVDPTCTAWRKRLKGVKTGNSKQILKKGDKKEEVLRIAEQRDIPDEAEDVLPEGSLEDKTEEEQKEIRLTIKRYFEHVRQAHEEAACAAGKLVQLVDLLDREHLMTIARAGTRPLVALEMPEVKRMIEQRREEVRKAETREELKNMSIDDVVMSQNLPTPLERWKKSKWMMPTRLLAAATHYFIYSQAVQEAPQTNKGVAGKFKVPIGSLHRITSGRRYAGGHAIQKLRQEEHGEALVKVSKKKKEKGKTAVTTVQPTGTKDVEEGTPARGTRKRKRSRGEAEDE